MPSSCWQPPGSGVSRRHDRTASDRPARLAATADLHDLRIIKPDNVSTPADAVIMRLVHRNLQAKGYKVGERFVVLPDADYCRETKSGLSDDNRARRKAIEELDEQLELLQELPGVTDRRRLRVGLDCKSAPIAAKILTGEHLGNDAWEEMPVSAPCDGRPA